MALEAELAAKEEEERESREQFERIRYQRTLDAQGSHVNVIWIAKDFQFYCSQSVFSTFHIKCVELVICQTSCSRSSARTTRPTPSSSRKSC